MPVLLILVLLPMQYALWWHGKQAADLAVEEGVDAAQVLGVDPVAAGTDGVYSILGQAGNLTDITVSVTTTPDTVIVEVHGTLNFSILSTLSVTARAEGPLERFVPGNQR